MNFKDFDFELPAHLLDELEDAAAEIEEAAEMISAIAQFADFIEPVQDSLSDETIH